MEDVKIKTGFGGLRECCLKGPVQLPQLTWNGNGRPTVTLVSLSLILSLTVYEFIDYRRVHMVRRSSGLGCCTTA